MWRVVLVVLACVGCAPEVALGIDLHYANARVANQTDPASIIVVETDLAQPYDVLGDVQITMRQRTAFGEEPTRERAIRELREQAGRIGAHAVVMLSFGERGMSWWSYSELRGHGRAVRFR